VALAEAGRLALLEEQIYRDLVGEPFQAQGAGGGCGEDRPLVRRFAAAVQGRIQGARTTGIAVKDFAVDVLLGGL